MQRPVIHPVSNKTLSLLISNLPQSLLLSGPVGVGLSTIAHYIASQVTSVTLTVLPEKDDKVDIDKGVISVDSIRRLYTQTRSIHKDKQVIIIDYAERMGPQAQNAFLKLLEEPGRGVYFILVTHAASRLLPTVTSRTQLLELLPTTSSQSGEFLDALGVKDSQKRMQMLFMAEGLPAEMSRLAASDEYFARRSDMMRDARDLLQAASYKKLIVAHKYKDNRDGALALIGDACNILRRSISSKPSVGLIGQIDNLLLAERQIRGGGNIRLCLARLVL